MNDEEGNSGGFVAPGTGPQRDASPDVPAGVIAPGAAPRKLIADYDRQVPLIINRRGFGYQLCPIDVDLRVH